VAKPPFLAGGAGGDLQRLQRAFAAQLHPVQHRVGQAPSPLAVGAVLPGHVLKGGFQRLNHALRRAMRDVELSLDLVKTDPAMPGRRHAGQPQQILCLGETHAHP